MTNNAQYGNFHGHIVRLRIARALLKPATDQRGRAEGTRPPPERQADKRESMNAVTAVIRKAWTIMCARSDSTVRGRSRGRGPLAAACLQWKLFGMLDRTYRKINVQIWPIEMIC